VAEAGAALELGPAAVLVGMAARATVGVEREPAQVREAALELGPEAVPAGWGVSALVLTRPSAPVRMLQSEPERGMPSDMGPVMARETRGSVHRTAPVTAQGPARAMR